nr:proteoglycan 4-like [Penaeus vannamei]
MPLIEELASTTSEEPASTTSEEPLRRRFFRGPASTTSEEPASTTSEEPASTTSEEPAKRQSKSRKRKKTEDASTTSEEPASTTSEEPVKRSEKPARQQSEKPSKRQSEKPYVVTYHVLPYMDRLFHPQLFARLETELGVRITVPKGFSGDLLVRGSRQGVDKAMNVIEPLADAARERNRVEEAARQAREDAEARKKAVQAQKPQKPQGPNPKKWPIKEDLDVPKDHHRFVVKAAREITTTCKVRLVVPPKDDASTSITIWARSAKALEDAKMMVEQAMTKQKKQVRWPITETLEVPKALHRFIVTAARAITSTCQVKLVVPPKEDESTSVLVYARSPEMLEAAKVMINEATANKPTTLQRSVFVPRVLHGQVAAKELTGVKYTLPAEGASS